METGKTTRYLKYALGEIILVVIGILIALQINNWNELRKDRNKEIAFIQEIEENLNKDIQNISKAIEGNQKKLKALEQTVEILLNYNSDKDIAKNLAENFDIHSTFFVFRITAIAFDNLLNSEQIDLIQDKDLRTEMSLYYQEGYTLTVGTQTRVIELTRKFADLIAINSLYKDTINLLLKKQNNWPSDISIGKESKTELLAQILNLIDNIKTQNIILREVDEKAKSLIKKTSKYL